MIGAFGAAAAELRRSSPSLDRSGSLICKPRKWIEATEPSTMCPSRMDFAHFRSNAAHQKSTYEEENVFGHRGGATLSKIVRHCSRGLLSACGGFAGEWAGPRFLTDGRRTSTWVSRRHHPPLNRSKKSLPILLCSTV